MRFPHDVRRDRPVRRRRLAADECKPAPFFDGKTLAAGKATRNLARRRRRDRRLDRPERPRRQHTFLCTKAKYKDFELKCKVRLKAVRRPTSGIQIRSEMGRSQGLRR